MRILYGVQATGNGHITRSSILGKELRTRGADVVFLLSGRPKSELFNTDAFGDFLHHRGLTFHVKGGKINIGATIAGNNTIEFLKDVRSLDLHGFDLVVNDYEPISAWAARLQGIPSIGISHQCAFRHSIPKRGLNPVTSLLLRWFAPTDEAVGLHWHHFNSDILPPIVPSLSSAGKIDEQKILVYLPFEDLSSICALLGDIPGYEFHIYYGAETPRVEKNLSIRPLSRDAFLADLTTCNGVICNAGFELPSEILQLGRRMLVRPLSGQPEQLSNGAALSLLDMATVTDSLSRARVCAWLETSNPPPIPFPNVAAAIADWVCEQYPNGFIRLKNELWSKVDFGKTARNPVVKDDLHDDHPKSAHVDV